MNGHRRLLIRYVLAALVGALVVGACGIPEDRDPRAIGVVLATPEPTATPAPPATQDYTIFLIDVNGNLSRVVREVPDPLDLADLLNQLTAAPSAEETARGLATAIPAATEFLREKTSVNEEQLVTTLNLNEGSFDSLTGDTLLQALAQFVYTFTESGSIERVVILIEGESRPWPTSSGAVDGPLSRADYESIAPDAVQPTPVPTPTSEPGSG